MKAKKQQQQKKTPKNNSATCQPSHLKFEELLHLPDLGLKGSCWRLSTLQTSWKAVEPLEVFL